MRSDVIPRRNPDFERSRRAPSRAENRARYANTGADQLGTRIRKGRKSRRTPPWIHSSWLSAAALPFRRAEDKFTQSPSDHRVIETLVRARVFWPRRTELVEEDPSVIGRLVKVDGCVADRAARVRIHISSPDAIRRMRPRLRRT